MLLRHLLLPSLLGLLVLSFAPLASAQRNPAMPSQYDDAERENLYARFSENKKVKISERQRLAYEAAREYVKRFENERDPQFREARKFVNEYEAVIRHFQLDAAYRAHDYEKTFELGQAALKTDAGDFYVLSTLALSGFELSQKGNQTHNEMTVECTRKALDLMAGGKASKPEPFVDGEAARGFLNLNLGWFLRSQAPVEAAAALVNAANANSSYKTNPLTYNLLGISILKGEYAQLSNEYNTKFGNKPPSTEQEQMYRRLSQVADRVIDAYARAVALSSKPEQAEARAKILNSVSALYKSFHNNSDAGLNELIATVLTKPLP